jgi:competence ComEA-like helix-hairpin-helix protein
MSNSLKDFFYYTKQERLGVILLIITILLINSGFFLLPYLFEDTSKQDFSVTQEDIAAFEEAIQEREQKKKFNYNKYKTTNTNSASQWKQNKEKSFPPLTPTHFDPNTASQAILQQMNLPKNVIKSIINYRAKGGKFKTKQDFGKIYTLTEKHYQTLLPFIDLPDKKEDSNPISTEEIDKPLPTPFSFDPNTASAETLEQLGLKNNTIQSILNYRNKGGQFRTKEDFKKIYTLSEATYQHLESVVEIVPIKKEKKSWTPKALYAIDVNTASLEDFQQFRGIGPSFAKRILKYRTQLGGFTAVDQVSEVYGLADSTYQEMKIHLSCQNSNPPSLININTATLEELKAHPYLRWFHAKAIIEYRENEGKFKSIELLQILEAFDDNKGTYKRIAPYLTT